MIFNAVQEAQDRERETPKIRKARIAQSKREKGKHWIPVPNSIGNLMKLSK